MSPALCVLHLAALIFCLIDIRQEHAKPLRKMAGFPCSAFLALHLTAIIILQGAQSKATQRATMPNSNATRALAAEEQPRIIPAENGPTQDQNQVDNGQGCPNCKNKDEDDFAEDSAEYKIRIEMIKAKILEKLQLDREPVLVEKPKENRIAALLANLNLIDEGDKENEQDESEDEFYGKATKIIVFSEKGRRSIRER